MGITKEEYDENCKKSFETYSLRGYLSSKTGQNEILENNENNNIVEDNKDNEINNINDVGNSNSIKEEEKENDVNGDVKEPTPMGVDNSTKEENNN